MRKLALCASALAITLTACSAKTENEKADKAAGAETKVTEAVAKAATREAYFGDLHVHTKNSFDAFIIGTRTNADDAYRFAKGETIDNGAGHPIKLDGPPLDFYSVTDHGEYMGVVAAMADPNNPLSDTETAKAIFHNAEVTHENRLASFIRVGLTIVTGEEIEEIYDREFIDSAWAVNVAAAEKHNNPGTFTTFAGYEFTAMQLQGTVEDNLGALNLHRNVIFEDEAPKRLQTTLVSNNPEDLWDWMDEQRANGIESVSIPHNSNSSNGTMFALTQTNGSPITAEYAAQRMVNEPIVEMAQIKGTSETHPMLSPEDEFADHELYEILVGAPVASQKLPGGFVRQSLARGFELEDEIGANPYEFGFIGSSDTHVSAPSLTEETHFGKFPTDIDPAFRGSVPPDGAREWEETGTEDDTVPLSASQYAASGLAGVWADANTRQDIHSAFRRKETFGTSGPRIKVRMFAGAYSDEIIEAPDMLERAYSEGSPMGTNLKGFETSPAFIVWAMRDANSSSLQRAQMIKVWHEGGTYKEAIYDVACAGGVAPDVATQRCPDNGAAVDLSTCETSADTGAAELKTVWRDPGFDASQKAAYYVRVLENPKCRWSTWDAVRNGTPPNPDLKSTVQDRAWGSPVWVMPN